MKKVLLIDSSSRKNGNSTVITQTLAADLQDAEVTVFTMRDKACNFCMACGACQGKTTQACIQKDDIAALIASLDTYDALVIATPVYNHQISARAKQFIERFYPFFNLTMEQMSNATKRDKKAALICSCWGGPADIYEKYAQWTLDSFAQIGVSQTKALVFSMLDAPGAIASRADDLQKLHALADWLKA